MTAARRCFRRQDGQALPMAIGVMFLAGVIALVLSQVANNTSQHSRQRDDRVIGLAPADSGASQYLQALQASPAEVSAANGYLLSQTTMQTLAQGSSEQVLADTDPLVANEMRNVQGAYYQGTPDNAADSSTAYQYTMREALGNGSYGYWQIFRVDEPDVASGGDLSVWIRAWIGTASGSASQARTVRIEYRPGFFSGYLLLADTDIGIVGNATLNGNVHSNGFGVDPLDQLANTLPPAGAEIWFDSEFGGSSPTCVQPAGGDMLVDTSQGSINLPGAGSCTPYEATSGGYVNLLNADTSFQEMSQACGGTVTCPAAGGVASWLVRLSGSTLTYRGLNAAGATVGGTNTVAIGAQHVLLFNQDVSVTGTATGHLTIATYSPGNANDAAAAPDITIDSGGGSNVTVGSANPNNTSDVVGLVAQGNIVVDVDGSSFAAGAPSCGVTGINAAMVAESGRLTIPTTYTNAFSQIASTCAKLTVDGSMAGHFAPRLYWQWADNSVAPTRSVGYTTRNYTYDQELTSDPPPFYPMTGAWQQERWSDANIDCLSTGANEDVCQ